MVALALQLFVAVEVFALAAALAGEALGPATAPLGRRISLTDGTLFVPSGATISSNEVDITLHLHGAAWVTQQGFGLQLPSVKW